MQLFYRLWKTIQFSRTAINTWQMCNKVVVTDAVAVGVEFMRIYFNEIIQFCIIIIRIVFYFSFFSSQKCLHAVFFSFLLVKSILLNFLFWVWVKMYTLSHFAIKMNSASILSKLYLQPIRMNSKFRRKSAWETERTIRMNAGN